MTVDYLQVYTSSAPSQSYWSFQEAKSSCSCEISDQLGLPITPQYCFYGFSFKHFPNMQLQNTREGIILSQACWEVLSSKSFISISSYSSKIWITQFWELKPENGSAENKWMYASECWPRNVTLVYTKEDQEINLCVIINLTFFILYSMQFHVTKFLNFKIFYKFPSSQWF